MSTQAIKAGIKGLGDSGIEPDGPEPQPSIPQSLSPAIPPPDESELRAALSSLIEAARDEFQARAPARLVSAALAELFNLRQGVPTAELRSAAQKLAARDRQIADLRSEREQLRHIIAERERSAANHWPLRETLVMCQQTLRAIQRTSDALIDADLVPITLTHAFALHRDWAEEAIKQSADALKIGIKGPRDSGIEEERAAAPSIPQSPNPSIPSSAPEST